MKRDPEKEARYNANKKFKLENDPAYREKVLAQRRARWHIKKTDPAYLERVREQQRANAKRKYSDDPEYRTRVLDNHNRWSKKQDIETRLRRRLDRYGISVDHFKSLYAKQEGRCAICSYAFENVYDRQVQTDHDHSTRLVRGLLCSDCNTSLGKFGDTLEGLMRAVRYLERF